MSLEEESENRQKLENELNSQITALEKNCQGLLEEAARVRKYLILRKEQNRMQNWLTS